MATATLLIPEKDAERARELERHFRDVVGLMSVEVKHEPFDPRGPEAELLPFEEFRVNVSYDSAQTSLKRIKAALKALGVHILDAHETH